MVRATGEFVVSPAAPVEQQTPPSGEAAPTSAPAEAGSGQERAALADALKAVPSIADAIRARVSPGEAKGESESSANAGSSDTDASPKVTGQSPTETPSPAASDDTPQTTDTTSDGASGEADFEASIKSGVMPTGLTRGKRRSWRHQREEYLSSATDADQSAVPAETDIDAIDALTDQVEALTTSISDIKRTQDAPKPNAAPSEDVAILGKEYTDRFGDDATFQRRADARIRGDQMPLDEEAQLEVWANNRLAKGLTERLIYRDVSTVALSVAEQRGIDTSAVTGAPNLSAVLDAFWLAGNATGAKGLEGVTQIQKALDTERKRAADLDVKVKALSDDNAKLKATNDQIADELDTLQKQKPAMARQGIVGGLASLQGLTVPLDPAHQSGNEMLRIALANRSNGSRSNGTSPAVRNR